LEVRSGMVGTVRMRLLAEEHGGGQQLIRIRLWSRCAWPWLALIGLLLSGAAASVVDGAGLAAAPLALLALVMVVRAVQGCARATLSTQSSNNVSSSISALTCSGTRSDSRSPTPTRSVLDA